MDWNNGDFRTTAPKVEAIRLTRGAKGGQRTETQEVRKSSLAKSLASLELRAHVCTRPHELLTLAPCS